VTPPSLTGCDAFGLGRLRLFLAAPIVKGRLVLFVSLGLLGLGFCGFFYTLARSRCRQPQLFALVMVPACINFDLPHRSQVTSQ
jgi:hypothetical protein